MTEGNEQGENKREPYSPPDNAVDITLDKDGGVLKEIKTPGEGTDGPLRGDRVTVHYVGFLPDGTIFDSSRTRGEKFEFNLGKGEVIKAWDQGIASMKKGEVCVLYCQPDYAYGETGSPPTIPPDAVLVFEVELFSWKGEDLSQKKDGGIIRHRIEKGEGTSQPNEGAQVQVLLVGRYNGQTFDDRSVSFSLGEGVEHGIVSGLEKALERFRKGEKSIIKLTSKYAFGVEGNADLNIPPNADVEYEVTLIDFEKAKESWEMDSSERIDQAKIFKEKGTIYFKESKFDPAIKYYKKIVSLLEYDPDPSADEMTGDKAESQQLQLAAQLNLAMSYLKLNNYPEAAEHCDKALNIDEHNEKGLFRRGQARLGMSEFELAKEDFEAAYKVDPANKAAANQIIVCNNKIKEQKDKDRRLYANMFQKFADQDTKREQRLREQFGDVLENPGTWGDAVEGEKKNHLPEEEAFLTKEQKEELEAQVSMIND
jgi:FKBP-type peptidyl-prolyl cis-trans isomerase